MRRVTVKYVNPSEDQPRYTDRSVRHIVSQEDTPWREDMKEVKKLLAVVKENVAIAGNVEATNPAENALARANAAPADVSCGCCCDGHCSITSHLDTRHTKARIKGLRGLVAEMEEYEAEAMSFAGWDYEADSYPDEEAAASKLDISLGCDIGDIMSQAIVSLNADLHGCI